jgi:multisubunit Na+/H+ antiporter MnhC subunit
MPIGKTPPKRHPLKVALILTALLIAVPSVALTAIGLGLTVGVLFGWMSRGLGKT